MNPTGPTMEDLLSIHNYFNKLSGKSEKAKEIINEIEEKVAEKIKSLTIHSATNNIA